MNYLTEGSRSQFCSQFVSFDHRTSYLSCGTLSLITERTLPYVHSVATHSEGPEQMHRTQVSSYSSFFTPHYFPTGWFVAYLDFDTVWLQRVEAMALECLICCSTPKTPCMRMTDKWCTTNLNWDHVELKILTKISGFRTKCLRSMISLTSLV